jgi:hypothetical protein
MSFQLDEPTHVIGAVVVPDPKSSTYWSTVYELPETVPTLPRVKPEPAVNELPATLFDTVENTSVPDPGVNKVTEAEVADDPTPVLAEPERVRPLENA